MSFAIFSGLGTSTQTSSAPVPSDSDIAEVLCSTNYSKGFATLGSDEPFDIPSDDVGCFKIPTKEETMSFLEQKQFAKNTEHKILWASNLYKSWWFQRVKQSDCDPRIRWCNLDELKTLNRSNLSVALCHFMSEIKRKDGAEFLGQTLYQITIMLQLYLEKRGFNFKLIDDPEMFKFKNVLDNLMKGRSKDGIGRKESSEAISLEQEEVLWGKQVFGESSPDQLRETVLYLLGVNLALRGGEEHKRLRCPGFNPQITVQKVNQGVKFLLFKEDLTSKTNQGDLSGHKCSPRELKVYGSDDPKRNIVRLFEKYISLLPSDCANSSFYKYALSSSKKTAAQWFSDRPVGVNMLKKVVRSLCKRGGIEGKFMNHSLRATCATRMFHAGIDEQVIKSFTGHKSDAVCDYKRLSETLLKNANKTVSLEPSKPDPQPSATESHAPEFDIDSVEVVPKSEVERAITLSEMGCKTHKNACPMKLSTGECGPLCSMLHQIDQKNSLKAKKIKLSLKFHRSNLSK